MGTNYFLHQNGNLLNRLAGRDETVIHLGKSSGGWVFALKVYPSRRINSLKDWYKLWRRDNNIIKDENGGVISITEMIDIITNRSNNHGLFGHSISGLTEWAYLDANQAEYGPNGLLRTRIRYTVDENFKVIHGPGTWDLHYGEFS